MTFGEAAGGKLAVSAARWGIRKLAAQSERERLVSRVVRGIDTAYRLTGKEQRALDRFIARESTWPFLVDASLVVPPEFVDAVEREVLAERSPEDGRRGLAEEIAALAKAELPAAVGAEWAFNLLSRQVRDAADRQIEGQASILDVLEARGTQDEAREADLAEYRRLLAAAMSSRAPSSLYECRYSTADGSHPIADLDQALRDHRWSVLQGPAGYGKSAIIATLALELNTSSTVLVVHVDLKAWSGLQANQANELTIDSVLKFSAVAVDAATVERLILALPRAGSRVVWLIDGINELPSWLSQKAVDLLAAHMRPRLRSCVLVADRSDSRYAQREWKILRLQPLDPAEVCRELKANNLPAENTHEILTVPFFLTIALAGRDPSLRSRTQALHDWFSEKLALTSRELDQLARFATATTRLEVVFPSIPTFLLPR